MTFAKTQKVYIAVSSVLLVFLMGLIFFLSSQNATDSSETSDHVTNFIHLYLNRFIDDDTVRGFAHFFEFALLGFLFVNLFFSVKRSLKIGICTALSWAYAWTDEIHQIFVEGRAFQLIDLTVDLAGIIFGVVLFSGITVLLKRLFLKRGCKKL